jgi:hypothetical protein
VPGWLAIAAGLMAATRFARLSAALAIAAGLMAATRFARLSAALAIAARLARCDHPDVRAVLAHAARRPR